jgi:hypothetical protein
VFAQVNFIHGDTSLWSVRFLEKTSLFIFFSNTVQYSSTKTELIGKDKNTINNWQLLLQDCTNKEGSFRFFIHGE